MARVIIYRGDALDREMDLGETTVRVGRADDNEIVLTDPTKGVSRLHAELRFEHGQYVVVDLKSQNGVWVEGRRVPSAPLQIKVPVVLGPYRLLLKDEQPGSAGEATLLFRPTADPSGAATVMLARPPAGALPPAPVGASQAVPVPEAKPVPAAPVPVPPPAPAPKAEPPPAPVPVPAPPPKPPPPPEVKPAAVEAPKPAAKAEPPGPASAAPKAPAKPVAPRRAAGKGLWYVAAAAVVLALGAGGVFLTPIGRRLAGLSGAQPVATPAPAPTPPPPAVTPTVVTPPPAPEKPPVRPPVEKPPVVRPTTPRPTQAAAPAVQTRPTPPPARPVPPAATSKPTPPPPAPPPPNPATLFEQARNASIDGDFLRAIGLFEQLLKIAPTYPGAAEQLTNARNGARGKAGSAIVSGEGAQQKRDYVGAMKQYELALQLDPQSTLASDRILRLKTQMLSEGIAAFNAGEQYYSRPGREKDAITSYQRALELLPADHPHVKTLREKLAELLKGGHD